MSNVLRHKVADKLKIRIHKPTDIGRHAMFVPRVFMEL